MGFIHDLMHSYFLNYANVKHFFPFPVSGYAPSTYEVCVVILSYFLFDSLSSRFTAFVTSKYDLLLDISHQLYNSKLYFPTAHLADSLK